MWCGLMGFDVMWGDVKAFDTLTFEHLVDNFRPLRGHFLGHYGFCTFFHMCLTPRPHPFWKMFIKMQDWYVGASIKGNRDVTIWMGLNTLFVIMSWVCCVPQSKTHYGTCTISNDALTTYPAKWDPMLSFIGSDSVSLNFDTSRCSCIITPDSFQTDKNASFQYF